MRDYYGWPTRHRLLTKESSPKGERQAGNLPSGRKLDLTPWQPRRNFLTVLFSDIRDYSTFTAECGDEEGVQGLHVLFAFAKEQVQGHKGRLVKPYGDGVMAVFSKPQDGVRRKVSRRRATPSCLGPRM